MASSKNRSNVVEGIPTPSVCALVGISPSTLNYWVKHKLVVPSYRSSEGKRATRWWSVSDVVAARAIRALRRAGCPLQMLRKAKRTIEEGWGQELADLVLYWDGGDIIALEPWGNLVSTLRKPGQLLLHVVALPIDDWRREAEEATVEVDLDHLRELRRQRESLARQAAARLASLPLVHQHQRQRRDK